MHFGAIDGPDELDLVARQQALLHSLNLIAIAALLKKIP
jgi:hypothetical protein